MSDTTTNSMSSTTSITTEAMTNATDTTTEAATNATTVFTTAITNATTVFTTAITNATTAFTEAINNFTTTPATFTNSTDSPCDDQDNNLCNAKYLVLAGFLIGISVVIAYCTVYIYKAGGNNDTELGAEFFSSELDNVAHNTAHNTVAGESNDVAHGHGD